MTIYYFGCGPHNAGHYYWSSDGSSTARDIGPWGFTVDGGLQPRIGPDQRKRPDQSDYRAEAEEGLCVLHRKDGWTCVAWWDRSRDTRGKSCSALLMKGDSVSFTQMINFGRDAFPWVFARMKFVLREVRLVNDQWQLIGSSPEAFSTIDQPLLEEIAATGHIRGSSIGSFTVRQLARELLKLRSELGIPATMGSRAPLSYVTSDGVVLVPPHTRALLGLMNGGGVAFITAANGHVEMLNNEQLMEALGEDEEDDGQSQDR